MQADLIGRIANTRLAVQQALLPLFEAVVNSIHSCSELADSTPAQIDVELVRAQQQGTLTETAYQNAVESFIVTDNGLGFNEANFESFRTADSRHRRSIGGKGIGRFLWLVAFEHAEIDSTFQDEKGAWMRRRFFLRLTKDGIEEHTLEKTSEQQRRTIVRLVRVREKYQKALPKSAMVFANRIVEHCLQYYLLGQKARLGVVDEGERILLDDIFRNQIESLGKAVPINVAGQEFAIHNLRVRPTYGDGHRLYFCADKRLVISERLEGKLPNLEGSLKDSEGKPFVYSGYISGPFLDATVNAERTEFVMPDENSAFGDPTWSTLMLGLARQAQDYLEPFTAPIRQEKEGRIREFVRTKAPSYRPLVKHRPEILNQIPANLSDDKLDQELYRFNQEYDRSLKERSEKMAAAISQTDAIVEPNHYDAFVEEWNESGIAKLANHIAHRKSTLKILRASLGLTTKAKYSLEEAVHRLVCPLRTTSDDIPADQMNLWIIDEKLAFHFYLASDVSFKTIQKDVIDVNSSDRTDLLIFQNAAAFVEEEAPFSSVVIVEFKRPARNDYDDSENPINQVYRYVSQIRDGKAFDRRGRPISVPAHIPFYAYIIADLTPSLKQQAKFSNCQPNHDNSGFFTFNNELRTYVELISFDNLVTNAEKRNQFFFNQLNLPV